MNIIHARIDISVLDDLTEPSQMLSHLEFLMELRACTGGVFISGALNSRRYFVDMSVTLRLFCYFKGIGKVVYSAGLHRFRIGRGLSYLVA